MGGSCRPARGLPWPCRPGKRPALPPAGGVPLRPAAREARGRRRLRRQCARRPKLRTAAAARAERPAQAGRELAARRGGERLPGGLARPTGGPARARQGRYAGRRVRRQSRAARPAPQAWPGWQGWPECRRPGRRGGRPHSPHIVGAGPPRSTNAATGAGCARGKAREAARLRAWPCGGHGWPAQRLAAGLA